MNLDEAVGAVRQFAAERGWEAYHDPKNLVMALSSEVGELAAEFRWVSSSESDRHAHDPESRRRIVQEIGDVGIVLLSLCARMNVDLLDAIAMKLAMNAEKYPAQRRE